MIKLSHGSMTFLAYILTCHSPCASAVSPMGEGGNGSDPAIVFDSDRGGTTEIFVIGSDGSEPVQITLAAADVFSRLPDWSPDCSKIAYQSNRVDRDNRDIYVMASDGSTVRRITTHVGSDESPDWSPDGSMIAFASDRGNGEAIWIVDADGSGLRQLTKTPGASFQPAWSPDGKQVAFISGLENNWDLFVIRSDGSGIRKLTNTADRQEGGPAWSHDGREILFDGSKDGHWEIYVVGVDGNNERQLTRNDSMDARPAWSPDGKEIVFHSTRDFGSDGGDVDYSEVELYVMRTDGTSVRRLTENEFFDAHPDWCLLEQSP